MFAASTNGLALLVLFQGLALATTAFGQPIPSETPGPSSRLTPLVITEIMYRPAPRTDGRRTEFIEIYNADLIDQDLTGFRISGAVDFDFPAGYTLPAGAYAVIARDPADFTAVYGLTDVLGPFAGTNSLPNNGGTVRLRSPQGAILLETAYDNRDPWPVAPDGGGPSLVLSRPSFGEADPRAWSASHRIGGSPGVADVRVPSPYDTVVFNEVLARVARPQLEFLELYNHGNSPVPLGGCILTDDPATERFRIPDGTVLTPRGFLAFDETQLGFRLNAAGESLFLYDPDRSRVIAALRFGPQERGVSSGRTPDGSPEWRRLIRPSPGSENAPSRVSDVVINEILYAPISGNQDDEFVELYNRTDQPLSLAGWSFTDGIDFRFPAHAQIAPRGYLVIARNRDRLLANAPELSPAIVFGNYSGGLANSGERLTLAFPDFLVSTNALGLAETNRIDIEITTVTYGTGGRWGRWSDGLGSSLEFIHPDSDPLLPSNWADSDESAKAPWTTIEFTGRVDNVAENVTSSRLHLLAQGEGEYLLDDIQVLVDNANRVVNGDFANGLTGWTAQGNHRASSLSEDRGFGGGRALVVRATGRGDTAVNRVRTAISPSLAVNSTATLRARVRWLRGWPEFLLRTLGSGIEAWARLEVPRSCGTPGALNSRAVPNAGPAIFGVTHRPVVPAANQQVVVTARVSDPHGIETVTLRYRVDPGSAISTIAMRDDGTGGDTLAGDGVYSATLGGRTSGTIVGFHLHAIDRHPAPVTSAFPEGSPQFEAYIRWGETKPSGKLGVYRIWQRQADYDRLRQREPLANDNLDCTFVYGDERVIYNAGMRAKGSPWHRGSVGADYVFAMPPDDRLLGARDLAVVTIGNLGSDPSVQREQAAFWIGAQLGVPALHRRHVRLFENGIPHVLHEDTEEPNGLYVDRRFPDGPDGDLFKIEDWFEFNDAGNNFAFSRDATLQRFTTLGNQLKLARYRWAWRKRAVVESANDYGAFFQLVDVVNAATASNPASLARLESLADIEAWMRKFALQHIVGNWDAYGYNRGKNAYLYLPTNGRWQLIPWDIDFVLGSGGDGPTTDIFGANDPVVTRLWNIPAYARMYWRAFQDAIDGPLLPERIEPLLDARYAALVANGVRPSEGTAPTKSYVRQRRAYLANRLASVDTAAFAITSNQGADFATNRNLVTLTGTAPIAAANFEVNGVPYPVTWPTLTTWNLAVPLAAPTNRLVIAARDLRGNLLPGASGTITIRYNGPPVDPAEFLVINEIMFDPPRAGAGFVELVNTSPTAAFDVSGWRLAGVDFDFPPGSILAPGAYAVVAANLAVFRAVYGTTILPIGEFPGALDNESERLRLLRPGPQPSEWITVDDVRYAASPPWPTQTRDLGPSLQLIDARQDNRRPANWTAARTNDAVLATPGRANSIAATLEPFPNVWLNEVVPHNLTGAKDRSGRPEPWVELYNAAASSVDLSGLYLSSDPSQLTQWAFPPGTALGAGQFLVVWCDAQPGETAPGELHTNFRLPPSNGIVTLARIQNGTPAALDALAYPAVLPDKGWGSFPDGDPLSRVYLHLPTPGAPNTRAAPPLAVFINEWMASNRGAVLDPADGDPDDWFELHNASSLPADLSDYTLTDDPANPAKFRLPIGTAIPPFDFLLVWADNETAQTGPAAIHVNFQLAGAGETLGLFAPDGTPVDAIAFGAQLDNVSQGRVPDGGPPPFLFLDAPTPGEPNVIATANQPPTLAPIPDRTVDEGAVVAFRASATDPDTEQRLSFALLGAPPAARIDPDSGEFTWLTTEADGLGTYTFNVRVVDNGVPARSANWPVTITVREVNLPPTLDPIPPRQIDETTTLTFAVVARDPDLPPQKLTFSLVDNPPSGAHIDPVSGTFMWTPSEAQGPGQYTFGILVTDDAVPALTATRPVTVAVAEIDHPPVFEPVGLQSVDESTFFALALVALDPDPNPRPIRYSLDAAPPGAELDPLSGVFGWMPSEVDGPGSYNIVVRALEIGGALSSTLAFSIVVNEVNVAPQLSPIPDFDVGEGATVTFTASATDTDLPPQKLTFRLEPGAPQGASIDPASGTFTWPIDPDAGAHTNLLTVTVTDDALDARSARRDFTVIVRPRFRVVINEIHYAPPSTAPRTEFVELFNPSATTGWSLGGWRLTGFNFVFPSETRIAPGAYLVVARERDVFQATFGSAATVLGNADVSFPETALHRVTLERPAFGGTTSASPQLPSPNSHLPSPISPWEILDEVAFLRGAPWPAAAHGTGPSLQLIDPHQDNRRLANWTASVGTTTNPPRTLLTFTNVWRYFQTGPAPANWRDPGFNDAAWPSGPGLLYVEDANLPAPKNTPLVRTEGRMTYYFRTPLRFVGNPDGASLVLRTIVDDGAVVYLNGREIFRLGLSPVGTISDSTAANRTVGDAVVEGPFTIPATHLIAGDNVLAVEVHQVNATSSDIVWGAHVDVIEVRRDPLTPGYANSVRGPLDPFPDVWLNEVLPLNTRGATDRFGDRDPWIELVNRDETPARIGGWWLTDDFAQLAKWPFPAGATLLPRSLATVWADGEPSENSANEWHTSFRLGYPAGRLALVRPQYGQPAIVDFIEYLVEFPDTSFGAGVPFDPFSRDLLDTPTFGTANLPADAGEIRIVAVGFDATGQLQLVWTATPGRRYRLETRVHMGEPWMPVPGQVLAVASTATAAIPAPDPEASFYRIVRVD